MSETVWQGGGAWLTRRGCRPDDPDKWELGVTGEIARLDARGLYALKLAIEAQIPISDTFRDDPSSADHH